MQEHTNTQHTTCRHKNGAVISLCTLQKHIIIKYESHTVETDDFAAVISLCTLKKHIIITYDGHTDIMATPCIYTLIWSPGGIWGAAGKKKSRGSAKSLKGLGFSKGFRKSGVTSRRQGKKTKVFLNFFDGPLKKKSQGSAKSLKGLGFSKGFRKSGGHKTFFGGSGTGRQ